MISVIMTSFNSEKYIDDAIESIVNQTHQDWQLTVIDDCSTDKTFERIEDWWTTSNNFKWRKKVSENIGHTRCLNIALEYALKDSPTHIVWMDSDDISEPTRFEEQLKCFKDNIGIVTTNGIAINDKGKRIKDYYTDRAQRRTELEIKMFSETDWWVMGPSMMWKREVVDKIGGFDEEMYFCQDHNYWLRAIQHFGWAVCRKNLYKLRRHKDSVRKKMNNKEINWAIKSVERAKKYSVVPLK